MKFAQKTALCLFTLFACQTASASTETCPAYSEQDQFALVFRLFAPFHQKSNPAAALRKAMETRRVQNSAAGDIVFNQEVRKYLASQLEEAFIMIGEYQGAPISRDTAQMLAENVVAVKLELSFREVTGKELFEQDPNTLPHHIFTYFTTPYFFEVNKHLTLPTINRFDISSLMGYLHTLRVGLNYADKGIEYANKVLDTIGVPAV